MSSMHIPPQLQHTEDYKVSDFVLDNEWAIPQNFQTLFPVVTEEIMGVPITTDEEDELVWDVVTYGKMTVRAAYNSTEEKIRFSFGRKRFGGGLSLPKFQCWSGKL